MDSGQKGYPMENEFELVTHHQMHAFRLFLVNLLYRTPHVHKDFEICLILDGEITLLSSGQTYHASKHSFFLLNPFQPHELKADVPALILSVQVAPSFFPIFFPGFSPSSYLHRFIMSRIRKNAGSYFPCF